MDIKRPLQFKSGHDPMANGGGCCVCSCNATSASNIKGWMDDDDDGDDHEDDNDEDEDNIDIIQGHQFALHWEQSPDELYDHTFWHRNCAMDNLS